MTRPVASRLKSTVATITEVAQYLFPYQGQKHASD